MIEDRPTFATTPSAAKLIRRATHRVVENLERRVLLATVSGTVFQDINGDGIRQTGEAIQSGVTVFLDMDRNGSFTSGEPTRVTDANGQYQFAGVSSGLYSVGEVVVDATQTTPVPRSITVRIINEGNNTYGAVATSSPLAISADGRYALLETDSASFIGTNASTDFFILDTRTNQAEKITSQGAGDLNPGFFAADFSEDGRYVAYAAYGGTLISGGTAARQIIVYDRINHTNQVVSVGTNGAGGNKDSTHPSISADGRYIAFQSDATNLVAGDTDDSTDVFVYDRQTATMRAVSVDATTSQLHGGLEPSISATGQYVALWDAYNGVNNNIVVRDVLNSTSDIVGHGSDPSISDDGRLVAFTSYVTPLSKPDGSGYSLGDSYVFDRQSRTMQCVSLDYSGNYATEFRGAPQISGDGRFVCYVTDGQILANDTNGAADIYVYDRASQSTRRLSRPVSLEKFNTFRFSKDGSSVLTELQFNTYYYRGTSYISYNTAVSAQPVATIYASDTAAGMVDFGLKPFTTVDGTVYIDTNGNGVQDAGEQALPGVTVYADLDNDLTQEANEPSTTTGDTGTYHLTTSATGSVNVRVTLPVGYVQKTPQASQTTSRDLTLAVQPDTAQNRAYGYDPTTVVGNPALSADGRYLAYADYAGVHLLDQASGTVSDVVTYNNPVNEFTHPGWTHRVAISADGRYLAFSTYNTLGDASPSYGGTKVYWYDRLTQTIRWVDKQTYGGDLYGVSISGDGQYVGFTSTSTGIVSGFGNGNPQIYLYSVATQTVRPVSINASGATGNGSSQLGNLSSDGRYLVYSTSSSNIVPPDANKVGDVLLFDRVTGTNTRISNDLNGVQGTWDSYLPTISANGRFILFTSQSSFSKDDTTAGTADAYVYDIQLGTYDRLSVGENGVAAGSSTEFYASSISADGRFVTLIGADGLFGTVAQGTLDGVYVFDRLTRHVDRLGATTAPNTPGIYLSTYGPMHTAMTADGRGVAYSQFINGVLHLYYTTLGARSTPASTVVSAVTPSRYSGVNFGVAKTTLMSGTVWTDRNLNGVIDPGEAGVPNSFVDVYRSGVLIETVKTDSSGAFYVAGLPAANYALLSRTTSDAAQVASTATQQAVTLAAGQTVSNLLFGSTTPIVVSTLNDERDGNTSSGNLSFREALDLAAASPGLDVIQFPATLSGTIQLQSALGQLVIGSDVLISRLTNSSTTPLVIDAGTQNRAIYVAPGVTTSLNQLTIRNGRTTSGAGIYIAENATVTLDHVTVESNTATGQGGGIFAGIGTTVSLTNSTVRNNTSGDAGGGIASSGTLSIVNGTVSGNTAAATGSRGRGGGIYVGAGTVTGKNLTVANNTATFRGGGIYAADGAVQLGSSTLTANVADSDRDGAGSAGGAFADLATLLLNNTILAANLRGAATPDDVGGILDATGVANFIGNGDAESGLSNGTNGNRVGTTGVPLNPRLRPLGDYGGPVFTALPYVDSPVIDGGSATAAAAAGLSTDARGLPRSVAFGGIVLLPDIGAAETAAVIAVNALNDEAVDTDSKTSLREALARATAQPGLDVIQFAPGIAGGTIKLTASLKELVVDSDVDLQGPSTGVTLDGNYATRVLRTTAAAHASVSNLSIVRGSTVTGGGIANFGTLVLNGVLVSDNRATGGDGGGIRNVGTLTAVNSTIAGNTAMTSGAALSNALGGSSTLTNVSVYGNRADAGNTGAGRGAVAVSAGTVVLQNSIVAGNVRGAVGGTAADDVNGVFDASSGFDFIGAIDGSSGLSGGTGTQAGTAAAPADPKLVALAFNGGPTQTVAQQPGSPVTDAGSNALATAAALTLDQRGLSRFADGTDGKVARVDIGAFEQQTPLNRAPVLTKVATIGGAVEGKVFHLAYDTLLNASDAGDPEGAAVSFRVESVTSGTFTLGDGTPVAAGTLLAAGQELVWTPPAAIAFGTNKSVSLPALTVRAFDGQVASAGAAVAVSIAVTTVADPTNYVVLFSGGDHADLNYPIYYDNLKRMYQVVTQQYGVLPGNVFVVYADGTSAGADQPGGKNSDMSFATGQGSSVVSASKANLRQVLVNLSQKVDGNDHVMVWTFDHGLGTTGNASVTGEEVLRGWGADESISDKELKVYLQGLGGGDSAAAYGVPAGYGGLNNAGYTSYVFAQCFAGGMLDNLALSNDASGTVFGAASSNHYEASYSDYFAGAFTDALAAGYNNTQQAYAYAFGHDGRAVAAAANGGTWAFNVEHPWSGAASFPIFATARTQNAVPSIGTITPPKTPTATTPLVLTYDKLLAATGASDPTGQQLSFRFTGVTSGTLARGGVAVNLSDFTQATVGYGQSVTYLPPANTSGVLNTLGIQLVGADGSLSAAKTLPVRIGDPGAGVVAVDDVKPVQAGSSGGLIDLVGNDLRATGAAVLRVGQPAHGTVTLDAATGQVRYTPAAEYVGNDAFSYVVRDAAGNTDLATATLSVVPYDPAAQGQSGTHYQLTQLDPPPGYAGLPGDFSWDYRKGVAPWTQTQAVGIGDDGTVVVKTSRRDDGTVNYVGSTNASYRWQAGDVAPYWNASADGSVLASNAQLLLLPAFNDATHEPLLHDGRQIYDGVEATSATSTGATPNIRYLDPDNGNEAGFPPDGGLWFDVSNQNADLWQAVPQDLIPVDSQSSTTNAGSTVLVAMNAPQGNQIAQLYTYVNGVPTRLDGTGGRGAITFAGGARSQANALGAAGQVVGWADYAAGASLPRRGFVYANGQMQAMPAANGLAESEVFNVNKSGLAVGLSSPDVVTGEHNGVATTWSNGVATALPSLGGSGWSVAYDVNDSGVVAGASNGKAVVWSGGQVYNLNSAQVLDNLPAGATLTEARGINGQGQLAVTGTVTVNGVTQTRAFFLDLSSGLSLTADAVQTSSRRTVTFTPLANDTGAVSVSGVDTTGLQGTLTWNAAGQMTFDPAAAFTDLLPGQSRQTHFTYTARDSLGGSKTTTVTVTVKSLSTLYVAAWQPTASGFKATLNAPLDATQFNVYDGQDAGVDLPDVTLVGATTGPVRGSAHWDAASNTLSFVKTGGVLAADTYTLTLAGRADGVVSPTLGALDGNTDDAAGGDYVQTFAVAAAARTLTLPDFARGPGQAVDTTATSVGSGIPISLSDGSGLLGVSFQLRYDPSLLNVSAITLDPTMPAGWSIAVNLQTPGLATVGLYGTAALPAGARPLVRVAATVPATAAYRAGAVLSIDNVSLNDGQVGGAGDQAIQKIAYLGDTTGNGTYSGLDAALAARVAVGLDTGFDAYGLTDPAILADTAVDGRVGLLDASDIARRAALLDVADIPALPANAPVVTANGPDPTVTVVSPAALVPGASADVALNIDNAAGLQAFDLTVAYDPSRLSVLAAVAGSLIGSGWTVTTNVQASRVVISGYSTTPLAGGAGPLLKLTVRANPAAAAGTSPLDLEGSLNEGGLALTAVDGVATVAAAATPTVVSSLVLDDGTIQRSHVRTAAVTFSGVVPAANILAGAFTILQTSGTPVRPYAVNVQSVTSTATQTVVVLSFSGAGLVKNGSLADGRYTLSIDGSKITDANGNKVDAAGSGGVGSVGANGFFRLAGDVNGSGTVDFSDFLKLQASYGIAAGQPGYDARADIDGNGTVDFSDFLILQANYNATIDGPAPAGSAALPNLIPPPPPGTLGGFAFDDTNKNGVYDRTDTRTRGKTVFLDTNDNGKLDAGEKSTTTGANGTWAFTGLPAGAYHVRRVFRSGYARSTAAIDLTLSTGQQKTGLVIGTKKA